MGNHKKRAKRRSTACSQKRRFPVGQLSRERAALRQEFISKSKELEALRKRNKRLQQKVSVYIYTPYHTWAYLRELRDRFWKKYLFYFMVFIFPSGAVQYSDKFMHCMVLCYLAITIVKQYIENGTMQHNAFINTVQKNCQVLDIYVKLYWKEWENISSYQASPLITKSISL